MPFKLLTKKASSEKQHYPLLLIKNRVQIEIQISGVMFCVCKQTVDLIRASLFLDEQIACLSSTAGAGHKARRLTPFPQIAAPPTSRQSKGVSAGFCPQVFAYYGASPSPASPRFMLLCYYAANISILQSLIAFVSAANLMSPLITCLPLRFPIFMLATVIIPPLQLIILIPLSSSWRVLTDN